ncbi:hypothetical protein [Exiguobacterium sp. s7]|uniref:hypothetical protein n=1 Tax=Exiguobacterium sp. s7 TaxID=2751235 RepID=UPI001BE6A62D|nr:hypothetical protein [Exiguobacterium sp. s7]
MVSIDNNKLFFEPKIIKSSLKEIQINELLTELLDHKKFLNPLINIFNALPEPCDSEVGLIETQKRLENNFKLDSYKAYKISGRIPGKREEFLNQYQSIFNKVFKLLKDSLVVRTYPKNINERHQFRGLFLERLVATFKSEVTTFLTLIDFKICTTHFVEEPKFYETANPKKLLVPHINNDNPNVPDFFVYQTINEKVQNSSYILECKSSIKILKNTKKFKQYKYLKKIREKITILTSMNNSLAYLTYETDRIHFQSIVDEHKQKSTRSCKCNLCKANRSIKVFSTKNFNF